MARKKEQNVKKVVFLIAKGNPDVEGNSVKMHALNVVIRFMQMVIPEMKVLQDRNNIFVEMPNDHQGDPQWLKDNVFRFVDVLGTTDDNGAEIRAKKVYDRYMSIRHDAHEKVGWGLLEHYLNQFYLFERSASRFEVE